MDRVSQNYSKAIPLALLVLAGYGISSSQGKQQGRAFLLRTPELIEDGLRAILAKGMVGIDVRKRKLTLGGSGVSVHPDLVFDGGRAIGDVKYRGLSGTWDRNSLNQVVTFATAFHAHACAVFGFVGSSSASLPSTLPVGNVSASCIAWIAAENIDPHDSEIAFLTRSNDWLHS